MSGERQFKAWAVVRGRGVLAVCLTRKEAYAFRADGDAKADTPYESVVPVLVTFTDPTKGAA